MSATTIRRYRTLLVIVTLALFGLILYLGRAALTPFIIGGIIAYLLLPPVRRLERIWPPGPRWAPFRRPLSILVVYLVSTGLMVLAVTLVVPPLSRQIADLADRTPSLINQARERGQLWLEQYHALVPDELEATIDTNVAQVGAALATTLRSALGGSLSWLLRTLNLIIGLLIIPLWLFFVLKDERQGMRFFYSLFPPTIAEDVRAIIAIINNIIGRYIRGQLFLGVAIGLASFIGLTAIGVPYSLVLAVVNGLFELIPIVGPWLGAIPAIIVTLALAPDRLWLVVLFYVLLQQVENIFLVPKIQGDAVEINPAVIIIALALAGDVAGVWGLLAAVPLLAIARDVFRYLYRRLTPATSATDLVDADPGVRGTTD